MEHFTTDEGIKLNEIDSYLDQLDKNGLYIGKQNVWFELVSKEDSYVANIFVPIRDKTAQSAAVNIDFGSNDPLKLNLKEASGTREMLGYVAEDVITDGKTYQMQVQVAFQIASEEMYRTFEDGTLETAGLPSTAEVYVFRLDAVSLWGDELEVEDAFIRLKAAAIRFRHSRPISIPRNMTTSSAKRSKKKTAVSYSSLPIIRTKNRSLIKAS
ncbi:MAG: hypothetical protein ACLSA6_09090 [Holdemania massiliensis]